MRWSTISFVLALQFWAPAYSQKDDSVADSHAGSLSKLQSGGLSNSSASANKVEDDEEAGPRKNSEKTVAPSLDSSELRNQSSSDGVATTGVNGVIKGKPGNATSDTLSKQLDEKEKEKKSNRARDTRKNPTPSVNGATSANRSTLGKQRDGVEPGVAVQNVTKPGAERGESDGTQNIRATKKTRVGGPAETGSDQTNLETPARRDAKPQEPKIPIEPLLPAVTMEEVGVKRGKPGDTQEEHVEIKANSNESPKVIEDASLNSMTYFITTLIYISVIIIILFVTYHNRKKIIGLILDWRTAARAKCSRAGYSKLRVEPVVEDIASEWMDPVRDFIY